MEKDCLVSKKKQSLAQLLEFRHALSVKARYRLLEAAIEDRASSLEYLGFDDYASYLRSKLWSDIRRKVYKRANGKCEACAERKPENIHHWSYSVATLMGKKLKNLEAVCKICHDQFHKEPRRHGPSGRQLTPQRKANKEFWALVHAGGAVKQPRDMTPRLVKKSEKAPGIYEVH